MCPLFIREYFKKKREYFKCDKILQLVLSHLVFENLKQPPKRGVCGQAFRFLYVGNQRVFVGLSFLGKIEQRNPSATENQRENEFE
jgi:hypothetical protein